MYEILQKFNPSVQQCITQGNNYLRKNKIEMTLRCYNEALLRVSSNCYHCMLIHTKIGFAYSKQKKFSFAEKSFCKAEHCYMKIKKNSDILPTTFLKDVRDIFDKKAFNFVGMTEQVNCPVVRKIFFYYRAISTYTKYINDLVGATESFAKKLEKLYIGCLLSRGKIFRMWANLLSGPNSKPLLICAYKDFDMAVNMSKKIKDKELIQSAIAWRQSLVREN